MAALSTALLVGSMALTGASTYNQYRGQRRAARSYEAQGRGARELANTEAGFLDEQADDALARGREEEGRYRSDVSRLKGSQRARLAAQGIDIGSGSAAALQTETAILGEVDSLTIRNNARREAYGFKTQADLVRKGGANQAAGYANEAKSARNASIGTLLTGGAQIVGMYANSRTTAPRSTTPSLGDRARAIQPSNTPNLAPIPRPRVTVPNAKPWWQP